jgi:hypothetical protein
MVMMMMTNELVESEWKSEIDHANWEKQRAQTLLNEK